MSLTDAAIRQAKPKEKTYKLADSDSLLLLVDPDGSKAWRIEYLCAGREEVRVLGVYPKVTLAEARDRGDVFRKHLSSGFDSDGSSEHEILRRNAHRECTLELGLSVEDLKRLAVCMYYNTPMSDADKEILVKIKECQNKKVPQAIN